MTSPPSEDCIQVVLIQPLIEQFEEWLTQRNCVMFRVPSEEGDLPTYCIAPSPEAMKAMGFNR
jgi:hypothetical protein